MRKEIVCFLSVAFFSATAVAQSWLPTQRDGVNKIRTLGCRYDKAKLMGVEQVSESNGDWRVVVDQQVNGDAREYKFTFTAQRDLQDAGVAVAVDRYGWSSDNYVMIPASVYNGNRQRIVNRQYATGLDKSDYYRRDLALTSNPIPQLSPEFGAPSLLEVNVSNSATAAVVSLERAKGLGTILLANQGLERNGEVIDNALIVEESSDRSLATMVVSAPGVRRLKPEFISFSESPDRGLSFKKGEKVEIILTEITRPCPNVPELLNQFMSERKRLNAPNTDPRNLMPMSEVFSRMVKDIDDRYYENEKWSYYCPENADWISFGWIGGLMNTYPMLTLGDTEHHQRVKNTFDFGLSKGTGESGYFYDVLGLDGEIVYRDAAALNKGIGLTRKNGDVLYWMVKQFMLMRRLGVEVDKEWESVVGRLADAFVTTWQNQGTWGNYLNIETGDVAVFNTTSGAMTVGGLALAAEYFDNPLYMTIAREAAQVFYDDFALVGFTSGGCGDILQNSDSETAAALMTSLMTMYEVTGEKNYLKQSQDLANLCATWTTSFHYILPTETPLAKLGANLTGAVWASTQNKHGAPGFCTQSGDALFKIYRATGDTLYAELMRDIIHAHAEGVQPNGKITERLTYCDADSRGSRGDGGQTGWNELNGALMALEIPGIYIRTDNAQLYVFDHLVAKVAKQTDKNIVLEIHNPTQYDATTTILAEDAISAAKSLGENAFVDWSTKVTVKAGRTLTFKIPR